MRVESSPVDSPARRELRTFCYWMLAAVALGLVIRLADAYAFKWDNPPGGDAAYYHYQARAIVRGLWFVDPWSWAVRKTGVRPGAEHPPLYTLFLAIPSALGFESFREHIVSGTILGSFTCGVTGFAARAVAGRRVGIVAALLAAIYANLFLNDVLVMSETLVGLVTAFVIWVAYRFWRAPTAANAVLLGAACGFAVLSRAELILLFPLVAAPLVIRARGLDTRARVQRAGVVLVVAALPVLPWVGFNVARFHHPVTLSTGGDFTLGNTYCDSTFYGERFGWWDLRCMDNRWKLPGDESDVSLHFREKGLDYLSAHLDRFPAVVAARIGRMWDVYKPIQKIPWDAIENGRSPDELTYLGLFQFYVLAPLAIAGLVILRRRKTIIYPLVGLAVTCTLAAMIAFGSTRYRVPAEIAIVIGAAVSLVALVDRFFPGRFGAPGRSDLPVGGAGPGGDGDEGVAAEPGGGIRAPEPVAT
ncbi:MAG TPA: glycosyltransferase family 39 protein [Acidimicrobiia bacterium]